MEDDLAWPIAAVRPRLGGGVSEHDSRDDNVLSRVRAGGIRIDPRGSGLLGEQCWHDVLEFGVGVPSEVHAEWASP